MTRRGTPERCQADRDRSKAYYKGGPKPINHWEISGSLARGLLMTVYPFLSSARRAQVKAALSSAA